MSSMTAPTTAFRQLLLTAVVRTLLVGMIFPGAFLWAQSPSQAPIVPTRPAPLPLSGRQEQSNSVSVTQSTTNSGGGNSVNTINSSVAVTGQFGGSTPTGKDSGTVLTLTLENALSLGLRSNLGVVDQASSVLQARGQRTVARSELLPTIDTVVSEELERINLRTQGVESTMFPETAKFNFFDARAARLQQAVFDLVRIDNLHSASENLKASVKLTHNARDLVVLAVAGSYVQVIATRARVSAAQAQVETSRAIYQQAADRRSLGLAARLDVNRSQVQLQTEQQRLRSLQADLETQYLRLARIIGLPLGQQFTVAEDYNFSPLTEFTVEIALDRAFKDRPDLEAGAAGVRAAEGAVKAAHAERVPTLMVNADFGAAGLTPTHDSAGVYSVSGTLTIPLYQGGRIRGDIQQANAVLQQRKAELEDLRGQVDEDVRQAFIHLNSAADQVAVAKSNVDLAHDTLTQSRDRFVVGVTDTVEVVQAEQAVVQADDDYITAVFEHNLGKVSLARAMGNAEQTLPELLRKRY
jgi:outer membrane protein TolC